MLKWIMTPRDLKQVGGLLDKKLDKQAKKFDTKLDAKLDKQAKEFDVKLDTKLDEQAKKFDTKLDTKLDEQAKKFDAKLDAKLDKKAKKFDVKLDAKLEEQAKKFDAKLNGLEIRIGVEFDKKLGGLEQKMFEWRSDVISSVDALAKEIRDEREFREITTSQIAENRERIDRLEKKVFGAIVAWLFFYHHLDTWPHGGAKGKLLNFGRSNDFD